MGRLLSNLNSNWRMALAGLLLVAAGLATAWLTWPRGPAPIVITTPTPSAAPSPSAAVVVHVVGAVQRPGTYTLRSGARAEDAIGLAGGFTAEADPASLNLAARLVDGQQVVVKLLTGGSIEPVLAGGALPASSVRLNLNTASLPELDALPGIGPVLAQRIVERRQRLGAFIAVEQLRDEKLVPGSTYERIKDLVTVN